MGWPVARPLWAHRPQGPALASTIAVSTPGTRLGNDYGTVGHMRLHLDTETLVVGECARHQCVALRS